MKKNSSILVMLLAAVAFVGCSQNELTNPGADSSALADSRTQISLAGDGSNLFTTSVQEQSARRKSSILGDNDSIVEVIPNLGVFCLAREVQGTNPEATQVQNIQNWFKNTFAFDSCQVDNTKEQNDMFCLIHNLKSTRTQQEIPVKNGKAYEITWDKDTVAYYPTTQFYNYDFYAYYPYTDKLRHIKNAKSQNHRVEAYQVIDGKTDILWGRATAPEPDEEGNICPWEKKYAFSAKYFRDSIDTPSNPAIALKHALTRFKFKITPGATIDGGTDINESRMMKVEKIVIKNVKVHQWLNVADLDNLDMDLEKRWTNADGTVQNLVLQEGYPENDTIATYDLSKNPSLSLNDTIPVGDCLMVPPASSYDIQVILSKWEKRTKYVEDEYGIPQPVVVDSLIKYVSETPLRMKGGSTGFLSNKSYYIVITVHGPKQIGVSAFLKEWEDEVGPSFEL